MGNTCVGPAVARNGFFQSVSATLWRSRTVNDDGGSFPHPQDVKTTDGGAAAAAPLPVQNQAPEPEKMTEIEQEAAAPPPPRPPKKPHHVKRISSAGLQIESVLRRKTENLKEIYSLGRKLGQGQFGTTYLCVEKTTGKEFACKSIVKRKLVTDEDVEDVRREIQIMHHLAGNPNVISIVGAYEDAAAVHVVMELCAGGELFDRIIQRGHYTERQAAELARVIVGVVEACHSLGVMHRDLKPENFLFINQREDSPLKTIDFGLSIFFRPGTSLLQLQTDPCRSSIFLPTKSIPFLVRSAQKNPLPSIHGRLDPANCSHRSIPEDHTSTERNPLDPDASTPLPHLFLIYPFERHGFFSDPGLSSRRSIPKIRSLDAILRTQKPVSSPVHLFLIYILRLLQLQERYSRTWWGARITWRRRSCRSGTARRPTCGARGSSSTSCSPGCLRFGGVSALGSLPAISFLWVSLLSLSLSLIT